MKIASALTSSHSVESKKNGSPRIVGKRQRRLVEAIKQNQSTLFFLKSGDKIGKGGSNLL